jgi:energy-coupling factor transporter ATP-binding protein EcfA2
VSAPVLEGRGVSYRYPGAAGPALEGVDLSIAAGEFVLLAGRSGSGKSTLLHAACGLVPHFHGGAFAGEVVVGGRSTRSTGPAELAPDVGFVAQEAETDVVSTTVRAELELPLELRGWGELERARAVEEAALTLGIEPLLDRSTDSLSGGELQRVAIGAALVPRPPLLLLDEPTSQLDPVGAEELIALLRRLNEEWGVAVLLGEHRLERCLAAADRVLALEGGRLVFDGSPERFGGFAVRDAPWLAPPASRLFALARLPERPVTVKQARAALPGGAPASGTAAPVADGRTPAGPARDRADAVLIARRLAVDLGSGIERRRVLDDLDLELDRGERVALMGPNGAGKSTLLRATAGLLQPVEGGVEVALGSALLTQQPDDFLVRERVGEELPGEDGRSALRAVSLDVDPDRDPRDLSGGERQRLALAIALAGRGAGGEPPGLVCLDEPTRGLDRGRKAALVEWLEGLSGPGAAALLVATHDVEFAAAFADRVVLLARGRVLADGPAREVLAGGWYFATETARITGGRAITPEAAARLLGTAREAIGDRSPQ